MVSFSRPPIHTIQGPHRSIPVFTDPGIVSNIDHRVVKSFAEEWKAFHHFTDEETEHISRHYFDILKDLLRGDMHVIDIGCGSGRWSKWISGRVASVTAVDPGESILAADELLAPVSNVQLAMVGADDMPFADHTFDLALSVGVLHHVPDTLRAMTECVRVVKPGGLFYIYLYYDLGNRGVTYRVLFRIADALRRIISRLPRAPRHAVCTSIALLVYYPVARGGELMRRAGATRLADRMPLCFYQEQTFYVMRNDALDRFGTSLEQRFSRDEVRNMMEAAGLRDITFSDGMPWWHAVGRKPGENT